MTRRFWLAILLLFLCAAPVWAYTRTWNEAAPSDGSPANLLGQVVRQLKQDVRERLQTCLNVGTPTDTGLPKLTTCWVLIGLDAAKPASPADGLVYFSTDMVKEYVAVGGTWNEVAFCPTTGCTFTGDVNMNSGTLNLNQTAQSGLNTLGGTFSVAPVLLNASNVTGDPRNANIGWYGPTSAGLYWTGSVFRFCNTDSGAYTDLTPGSATLTTGSGGC